MFVILQLSVLVHIVTATYSGYLDLSTSRNSQEARNRSSVDPSLFLGIESYSGFFSVKEEYNSKLFFWLFPALSKNVSAPLFLWLPGGPGYSALGSLFMATGPFEIDADGNVKKRKLSWCNEYSVLYLDNPVGSGFSFTEDDDGYTSNEDDIGEQMYRFLEQFYDFFPVYKNVSLYIAGQSYAGKYVPVLGYEIHRKLDENPIKLKGLLIGNGLIDPNTMMKYSSLCEQLGILTDLDLILLKGHENQILEYVAQKRIVDASNEFNKTIEFIKKRSGLSIYDFTYKINSKKNGDFEKFLDKKQIRDALHVGDVRFNLNNQYVYKKMLPDIMNTSKPFLEYLLPHYPIMGYSGQNDLILPYIGSKSTYESFQWSGAKEYQSAKRKLLRCGPNSLDGYIKAGGNFVDVLVRHAGHSVAKDNPNVMLCLMDWFIKNLS